ncbi:Beta-galactosidase, partial [Blastocystis sp. ATCC 50177/Nand II]
MFAKSLFFLALFCVSFAGNFTIAQDSYLLNGKPIQLMSAAFHYFRVHPDRWEDTFKKLANAGMNTVETYIAWNMHEPERGQFNFEGANDLDRYLTLAEKYGFLVIVRPGPYICAEWEFGGLPYWLLKEDGIKIRTKDPKYMEPVTQWMNTLLPVLSPHMIMNGGSIIMVQIENE